MTCCSSTHEGRVLEGEGGLHVEYPIHTEVMAARPDVGGVVHSHPEHSVALAAAGQKLLPVSHAANMFVPPDIPRFDRTADLITTAELGREVANALGSHSAVFLVNHGIVTVGPDVETAVVRAVILERACAQQLLVRGHGGLGHLVASRGVPVQAREHLPARGGAVGVGLPRPSTRRPGRGLSVRLATIGSGTSTTAAVVAGGGVIPISGYADVGALLRDEDAGLEAARAAERRGDVVSIEPQDLRMPVLAPGAVICVGLNYRAHILEMGRELPEHPTLFAKLTRSLTDPYADIRLPPHSTQVDYEGELVVVIGRTARDVPESLAHEHIAGFTLMNDVSMRDFQYRTLQWFAGKNFERSTPVGPWITTADEVPGLDALELRTSVNGDVRQRASLGDLVFSPAAARRRCVEHHDTRAGRSDRHRNARRRRARDDPEGLPGGRRRGRGAGRRARLAQEPFPRLVLRPDPEM